MIVICTKCQAKFRVADDKIGARGAKVRCSRCQTVFVVHATGAFPDPNREARQAAADPGLSLETPMGGTRAPLSVAAPLPGARNIAVARPGADPFSTAQDGDPFAAAGAPDPFAAPADPFSSAPPPASGDPFGDAAPRSTLAVTDLSDLLGARAPGGPPPLPRPSPTAEPPPAAAPDPFAPTGGDLSLEASSAPAPSPADPFGGDPFGADPFASPDSFVEAPAAPVPDLAAPAPAPPPADDGGLALEDRFTPPPRPVSRSPDAPLETADAPSSPDARDPFAGFSQPPGGSAEPFDPGAFDFGAGGGDDPFAAAPEAAAPASSAPDRGPATPPAQSAPAAPALAAASHGVAPASAAAPLADREPERIPGGRTSRLRAVAVNAVALVALLAVALALWAIWRADGPFEAASLRPSAILAALARGGADAGPYSAQEVRSGVYERARGAPLLFVRGRILSRAPGAVPAVKVAVEVVRGGQVVARGEAIAGAIPTPEELHGTADDAALRALVAAVRTRAPAEVRPGDAVPFLVAVGDAPAELEGTSLRVDATGVAGGTP